MIRRSVAYLLMLVCVVTLAISCSDLGSVVRLKPEAQLSSDALDFGTVLISQSTTRSLTIRNLGTAALAVTPAINGAAGYSLLSGASFAVAPGGSSVLDVQFTPPAVGTYGGTLSLGPDAPQVALSGNGALQATGAQSTLLPTSVDFGFVTKGVANSTTFQIFSTGTAPLLINVVSNAPGVSVVAGGGVATIDPGQSKTVGISFTPQAGGRVSGTIAIGPGCADLPVQGVGTTVSWKNDVIPIMDNKCSCHYFYDPVGSYQYVVNYPTNGYPPHVIVKPFDLGNSVMYGKITNSGAYGQLMPQGGPPLPGAQIVIIRNWILEGASNN